MTCGHWNDEKYHTRTVNIEYLDNMCYKLNIKQDELYMKMMLYYTQYYNRINRSKYHAGKRAVWENLLRNGSQNGGPAPVEGTELLPRCARDVHFAIEKNPHWCVPHCPRPEDNINIFKELQFKKTVQWRFEAIAENVLTWWERELNNSPIYQRGGFQKNVG